MYTRPRPSRPVASLSVAPIDRSVISLTEDGTFLLRVFRGRDHVSERRFALDALAEPHESDPLGSLVLIEDGERLVLPVDGSVEELQNFGNVLATALQQSGRS